MGGDNVLRADSFGQINGFRHVKPRAASWQGQYHILLITLNERVTGVVEEITKPDSQDPAGWFAVDNGVVNFSQVNIEPRAGNGQLAADRPALDSLIG